MEGKTMMNFTITFSLTQVLMLAIVIYLVAMFIIICSGKRGIGYSLLKLVLTTIMVVGLITYVVMNKMFQDRNENIILAMSYIVVLIFHKVIREVKLMAKRKMKQKNKEKEQKQQIEEWGVKSLNKKERIWSIQILSFCLIVHKKVPVLCTKQNRSQMCKCAVSKKEPVPNAQKF